MFDKHKNNITVLLNLSKSKNIAIFLTLGKSKKYSFADFEQVAWIIFNLSKTPLGETGCLSNPYFLLTDCLDIQFFYSFPFPNTIS